MNIKIEYGSPYLWLKEYGIIKLRNELAIDWAITLLKHIRLSQFKENEE